MPDSIQNCVGIDSLINHLKASKLAVLCGPSGTGKSSLLKYILPQQPITIGNLSGKLRRGRNTTRNVELYSLAEGNFVADSPGFNRPELKVSAINLQALFPELRNQKTTASCKFRDCLHVDEPGCSVNTDWERYSHYIKLLGEIISSRRLDQGG